MTLEKFRFKQKKRINSELVCLYVFAADWFFTEDLHYTDDHRRKYLLRELRKILGGPEGFGILQNKMNEEMDGILDRMQADLEGIHQQDLLVYSHSVAGLTNDLSARVAGLSGATAVSVIRNRLRERIEHSASPFAQEYLALLPKKGCRIGEEMLYLHNLKYSKPWKL